MIISICLSTVNSVRPAEGALPHREIMSALAGILLAIMLSALDQTIVTPALTAISTDFRSVDRLSWIVVAYLLASTSMAPIYGKLGDIYGRGRIILVAIALFVAASALCGLARTLPELVAARALQGIGGGGLIVVAQGMIADFISPRDRGRYQAYVASVWAFAGIAGPPFGGILADHLDWRWIFWINLPLGTLAWLLCLRAAKRLRPPAREGVKIDYLGALLVTGAICALLSVTTSGGDGTSWTAPSTLAIFGTGLILLAAFVAVEYRAEDPVLPPRLYAKRTIVFNSVIGFVVSMLMFAALVLLPVYFQIISGMPAAASGLMVIPMLCGIPIGSFTSGQIMSRTGHYKPIIPCALCLQLAAFVLFTTMHPGTNPLSVLPSIGLLGLGLGSCFPVLMISAQNAAEPRDVGVATSAVTFARSIGASFGAAIFWTILLAPLSATSAIAARALFTSGRRGVEALAAADRHSLFTALAHGFHDVFLIGAAVAALTFFFALFIKEEPLKTARRTDFAKGVPAHRAVR